MPTVFRIDGNKFFFYSNEGSPREPVHVHVRKGSSSAKIMLEPTVRVVESRGFNARELRVLTGLASDRAGSIRKAWNDHFG